MLQLTQWLNVKSRAELHKSDAHLPLSLSLFLFSRAQQAPPPATLVNRFIPAARPPVCLLVLISAAVSTPSQLNQV